MGKHVHKKIQNVRKLINGARVSLRGAYAESTFPYFFERPQNRGRLTQIAYAVHAKHSNLCFFPRGCHGPPRPYNIYIYETCAWTQNNFFSTIIVMESQGLPTMKCQTNRAKATFGGRLLGTVTAVPRGTAVTGQLILGLGT